MHGARRGTYDHHTARWLRALIGEGLKPEIVILHEVTEGERWQDIERSFIASAVDRGWKLTNSTAGGEGLDYLNPEDDARYRANLSRSLKEVFNRPEMVERQRAISRATAANPELLAKRNAAIREAYKNPSSRARVAAASRATGAKPEVKAARSDKGKAAWQQPDYRATLTAARNDPDFVAAQAERLRDRWADPEHREKLNAARWTEEKRREQAERIQRVNERDDPEFIARRNETLKAARAARWAKYRERKAQGA